MLKEQILNEAKQLENEIINNRHWLHQHAEVGFELKETKAFVRKKLEEMGYQPIECGKSGLVVTIGNGGKTFLLRADMDALPIQEETDLDYASKKNMHACGHDMHTAMLLGAAKLLKQHEDELNGTVKLMFQPAEEIFEGSLDMIKNGVLDNPRVDAALMIHVVSGLPFPAGTVIVTSPGVSAPAADYFTIKVQGKGCHGSTPHLGIDALTCASHILIALQEIHARELAIDDEAVLTIGKFNGGSAANAIADSAILQGTIRTYNEETRQFIKQRMTEISSHIGQTYRCQIEVEFGSGCPTLQNDEQLSNLIYEQTTDLLGQDAVYTTLQLSQGKPTKMGGSEDFAYISQKVPSIMLSLSASTKTRQMAYPQHHPKVIFDDSALSLGSAIYAYNAMKWLEKQVQD